MVHMPTPSLPIDNEATIVHSSVRVSYLQHSYIMHTVLSLTTHYAE